MMESVQSAGMIRWFLWMVVGALALVVAGGSSVRAQRQMERLGRGVVVVHATPGTAFVGWRLLGTEPAGTAFNVYRKVPDGKVIRLNSAPLTGATYFIDSTVSFGVSNTWMVEPVLKGKEDVAGGGVFTLPADAPVRSYLPVPLQVPAADTTPDGQSFTYSANDASVGDVDGDGAYEIILKWEPSNGKNPPQTGFTGNQLLDCYRLNGERLWRIDLGRNIRSGAAYTQFLVYDLDGDGKAEVVCKTADGTVDGLGHVMGDGRKDWRTYTKGSSTYGKIVEGPEFLTVFNGLTGAAVATAPFVPDRYPLNGWGGIGGNGGNDNSGGRPDRFTAGVAYLDGVHPSVVYVRGWYGRSVLAAWDFRKGKLTNRWVFDSKDSTNPYSGMGNHSLTVGDVDHDGKDEICIGSMTVDDDGKGLYTTGLRHGDALHMTVMDPAQAGMQVFGIHENEDRTVALQTPGVAMFDAGTGKVLWSVAPGADVGRGVAADIDPTHAGLENWGGPGGLRDVHGQTISERGPSSTNFVVWWDGDLTRELLDKNRIDKWDWVQQTTVNLLTAYGCSANNGSKATPALSADILGDWREEVLWRTDDSRELRIYTTTIPTRYRFYTLMHDPQYRLAIAWQNVSYNQPPHPGFYFGEGMKEPPRPAIVAVGVAGKVSSDVLAGAGHGGALRGDGSTGALAGGGSGTALVAGRDLREQEAAFLEKGKLLLSEDFDGPLDVKRWVAEVDPQAGSSVVVRDGKLVLDTKGGVTVWLNRQLRGNVRIEYDRTVRVDGGVNDRLSDLNQFWMATDVRKADLFTRNGVLESYDSLRLYYVGMGGNSNSTTRFRKYDGAGHRVLLGEYTDTAHLLVANRTYHVVTIVKDGATSFWVDGKCYFDYRDAAVLRDGYFGLRSTKSRQEVERVRVYQLK